MLAKVPQISSDVRQKSSTNITDGKHLLHMVNNTAIEEHENQRLRQSAETTSQKLGKNV